MPVQLIYEQVPTLLSVVQFDPRLGEEMFLTFSHGMQNGPEIQRTGRGSPFMARLRPDTPGEVTSHPDGLRLGSWLIQAARRVQDLEVGRDALAAARARNDPQDLIGALEAYIDENSRLAAHDAEFVNVYPQHRIIGQQGCGDLSMNLWHVGFLPPPLGSPGHELIFLHGEPLGARTYTCLVKWRAGQDPPMTIEDLRFDSNGPTPDAEVWVWRNSAWQHCGNRIEFAVSAKPVIRDGEPVDICRRTHQFSDLRHLLQMPNLNPNGLLGGLGSRPRYYFGTETYDDIWFGEAQLIADVNLQRAAMCGPVVLSRLHAGLSASVDQVQGSMKDGDYEEVTEPWRELQPGQYRFLSEDSTQVEVFFRRSCYGWSMIGLTEGGQVLSLACQGNPRARKGHTLEAAASKLLGAGACHALLIDEGFDVFQCVLLGHAGPKVQVAGGTELDEIVPLRRTRLRATFVFGCNRASEADPKR